MPTCPVCTVYVKASYIQRDKIYVCPHCDTELTDIKTKLFTCLCCGKKDLTRSDLDLHLFEQFGKLSGGQ